MLKGLEYETVLVKVAMAFTAAIALITGLILLMGIQFATCNPCVLIFGIVSVTILFLIGSFI